MFNAKNAIAASFIVVALSVAYYFVVFLPQKDREQLKIQAEQQDKSRTNKILLNSCLDLARQQEQKFWASECEAKGLKDDCLLPQYNANRADSYEKELKDECFKKYPQN